MLDRALTWFVYGWLGLICVVNLLVIAGIVYLSPSFGDAVTKIQSLYSPFNILNWIVEMISLSPALAAYAWREHRRKLL